MNRALVPCTKPGHSVLCVPAEPWESKGGPVALGTGTQPDDRLSLRFLQEVARGHTERSLVLSLIAGAGARSRTPCPPGPDRLPSKNTDLPDKDAETAK